MSQIVSEFSQPNKKKDTFHNPSGVQPIEYKCLVKPYMIEDTDEILKSAKEAGIVLHTEQAEREQMTQCIALLVAIGGNAFEDMKGPLPKVGDKILMAKYAGMRTDGIDGYVYRTIVDKDIAAILFDPKESDGN